MKKIYTFLFALVFLSLPLSGVLAHGTTGGYMMGSDSWDTNMMQFEDTVVDDDDLHQQMEDYMEALFDGSLTNEQEQQMLEWMYSDDYQPAVMSIMMREMMGSGWENNWSNTGMMGTWTSTSWGSGAGTITMVLIWAFLILGIAAFWKSITRSKK